jgi:hypothetical protein
MSVKEIARKAVNNLRNDYKNLYQKLETKESDDVITKLEKRLKRKITKAVYSTGVWSLEKLYSPQPMLHSTISGLVIDVKAEMLTMNINLSKYYRNKRQKEIREESREGLEDLTIELKELEEKEKALEKGIREASDQREKLRREKEYLSFEKVNLHKISDLKRTILNKRQSELQGYTKISRELERKGDQLSVRAKAFEDGKGKILEQTIKNEYKQVKKIAKQGDYEKAVNSYVNYLNKSYELACLQADTLLEASKFTREDVKEKYQKNIEKNVTIKKVPIKVK